MPKSKTEVAVALLHLGWLYALPLDARSHDPHSRDAVALPSHWTWVLPTVRISSSPRVGGATHPAFCSLGLWLDR